MIGKITVTAVPHDGVATPKQEDQWRTGGVPLESLGVIRAIYPDGGVARKSPSYIGGSSACVLVGESGEHWVACHYTVQQVALPFVSSNLAEFIAVLIGLECVPDNWDGAVFSDSLNAIRAWKRMPIKPLWVPEFLYRRAVSSYNRIRDVEYTLLGGHPTQVELANGKRKDGRPVSQHNVQADSICTEEIKLLCSTPLIAKKEPS